MARLVILCEYPTLSGGERSMLATLDGVCRAGFAVTIMAPGVGLLADACRARQIPLVPLLPGCHGHPAGAASGPSLASRREQLAGQLSRLRPELLHANSLAMGRLAGPVAAELGVPSVAHLRDIVKLSARAIRDLNANSRLVAVSEATRRRHVAAGLTADRTFVLYNGVDLGQFRRRPSTGYLHRELGIAPDASLLGSIGQISLRKAQDVLLAAATEVPAATDVHWLLVGTRFSDKPESRLFEEQLRAASERLAPRVHFLGLRDDMPRLLNELTLLVHPARQEPLGRVLLEAASSGTPVVATDVGGTGEIFPPEAARLVPPNDPAALAAAVADLLARPDRRAAMAAAARRRAEEHFAAARATAGLVEHYRAVVENG